MHTELSRIDHHLLLGLCLCRCPWESSLPCSKQMLLPLQTLLSEPKYSFVQHKAWAGLRISSCSLIGSPLIAWVKAAGVLQTVLPMAAHRHQHGEHLVL